MRKVAIHLIEKGIQVVLTGGHNINKIHRVTRFQQSIPKGSINLAEEIFLNVYLVQGKNLCVSCYLEGGDRHQNSRIEYLDNHPIRYPSILTLLSIDFH